MTDTAPGFWERMAAGYEAARKDPKSGAYQDEQTRNAPLHRHRGMTISQLISTCRPCAERKIRYLAEQPEFSHAGRNGRRLAEIHGVAYTPFENRSEAGQEAVGRREEETRKRNNG